MVEVFKMILQLKYIKKEKLYISQRNQLRLIWFYIKNKRKYKSFLKYMNEITYYMIENMKSVDETLATFKKEE